MQKIIILGNIGKDADVKTFDGGTQVANFSVAVTERGYKKADGTQVSDHTEWFNCSMWGKNLDNLATYLTKGQKVSIVGKNRTRTYDTEDGTKRYVTELIVDEFEFAGGNKSSEASSNTASQPKTQKSTTASVPPVEETTDDVPF